MYFEAKLWAYKWILHKEHWAVIEVHSITMQVHWISLDLESLVGLIEVHPNQNGSRIAGPSKILSMSMLLLRPLMELLIFLNQEDCP